jgi:hypothetical protein
MCVYSSLRTDVYCALVESLNPLFKLYQFSQTQTALSFVKTSLKNSLLYELKTPVQKAVKSTYNIVVFCLVTPCTPADV